MYWLFVFSIRHIKGDQMRKRLLTVILTILFLLALMSSTVLAAINDIGLDKSLADNLWWIITLAIIGVGLICWIVIYLFGREWFNKIKLLLHNLFKRSKKHKS